MLAVGLLAFFVGFPGAYRLVRRVRGKSPELPKA